LRVIDISSPELPREVGSFISHPADGHPSPQSNDVDVDERGAVYILDRDRGFDIVEWQG
jgi:hypothetical protein